jgi:Cft2 family RNA processing exonuclease
MQTHKLYHEAVQKGDRSFLRRASATAKEALGGMKMDITFHGGVEEVGGSNATVRTDDAAIALDYGIKVDEGLNYAMKKDVDAIAVSHAHLDHSGNLLTTADQDTVVIGSAATRDVTCELLHDMIKIHSKDGKQFPYATHDVYRIMDRWSTRTRTALPGMEVALLPAGHVLGANMVHLKAEGKHVLYTGDFCLHDTEILNGADVGLLPHAPDALIMESTYGGTVHKSREELVGTLIGRIRETMQAKGNILLPTFAFHRSQEMTRRIDKAIGDGKLRKYNAYYISGLAYRIACFFNDHKQLLSKEVQEASKPFDYRRVKRIRRTGQIREPALVICTPGFGHAGASLHPLSKWAGREANTVIVSSGYLPEGSPLNLARAGKPIDDNGRQVNVEASIEQIELSGHADQGELIEFVKRVRPKRTFLVHGNPDQCDALAERIGDFTDVAIPHRDEAFTV